MPPVIFGKKKKKKKVMSLKGKCKSNYSNFKNKASYIIFRNQKRYETIIGRINIINNQNESNYSIKVYYTAWYHIKTILIL